MLKLFFWLLLIGNAVLFAMQEGIGAATVAQPHEPQRLSQQLQPQALTILPPNSEKLVMRVQAAAEVVQELTKSPPEAMLASAPAVQPEMIACTEIGNFNSIEARQFEVSLTALNLARKPMVQTIVEAASYMVYIPSQDGKSGAEHKSAELGRLGIQDFYVIPASQANPALRWAISLGVFKTEAAAKAYVGQLIPKGVRSARIIARNLSASKQAYQWHHIDAVTQTALAGLKEKFPAQELRTCVD